MDPVSNLNLQIYQEASEWFVECRTGDLEIAMRQAFDSWLRKSPEHLRAYLELSAIWNDGPLLDPHGKYDQETLIAEAAADRDNVIDWSSARANLDVLPAAPLATRAPVAPLFGRQEGYRPSRLRLAAIAASLLLAAAAAALLYIR